MKVDVKWQQAGSFQRLSDYTGQNFSIQNAIQIIFFRVNRVLETYISV